MHRSLLPVPIVTAFVTLLAFACNAPKSPAPQPHTGTPSAKDYCASAPARCPASEADTCAWLLANGRASATYGGPIICKAAGLRGPAVSVDGVERWFLFDDAGIAAVVDLHPMKDQGKCVAGTVDPTTCWDGLVLYRCGDAGSE